jgi:thiamine pyrophosphokinase
VTTVTIFLNGQYTDAEFDRRVAERSDVLLAADGGAARLAALGLRPEAVVGDLDSLAGEVARELRAAGVTFERFPVRKDQTDAELAADRAVGLGAERVVLTGALGDMFDHVLGHVAVLRRLVRKGVTAELVAPTVWATVLCGPAAARLIGVAGRRFSLLALAPEAVITLLGFEYELTAKLVRADSCLCLGNRVEADEPLVRVHDGEALLMVDGDASRVTLRPVAA